jgi:hypothetical protein
MNKASGLWLDMTIGEESMRRITILPEKINDDTKTYLQRVYSSVLEEVRAFGFLNIFKNN